MKETSELLRQARISKNLSIEEISSQTKIQLHILKSLDAGSLEGLPNKIYIKGFLRQYAQALGLKAEEVIAVFDKETAGSSPAPTVTTTPMSRVDNDQMQDKTNVLWFRAPAKFISIIGVVIIVTLITSIYFFSMKIVSYSQETFQETATESSEPPSAGEVPQLDSLITKKEDSLALPSPESKPGDAAAIVPTPEDDAAKEAAPAEDTKPKIVSIEAKESVTIEASWSTGKKETIKLRASSKHVFYYAKKIKLMISDAGLVKITANEKDMGTPGDVGKPITLNFE